MKQEKYNIAIEKEVLRLNKNAKLANLKYPKVFGDKAKNNFITTREDNESIFILKSPVEKNVLDAYSKLEEITNIVYVECYNSKEIIWPFSNFEEVELSNKVILSINKEFYEEILQINKNLPKTLQEAYKNLKIEFNSKLNLIEKVFGKCTLKINKNNIEISNLKPDYNYRTTISQDELYFLVTFVFSCLEKNEIKTLSELSKELEKKAKLYSLKSLQSIKSIVSVLKSKTLPTSESLSENEKLEIAQKYMQEGYDTRYAITRYGKLVAACAAIVKDAIELGIDYTVLNENKSVIEFNYNGHKEYVIEGNKTDRDTYIFPIITDDKFIAKQVMKNAGLCVPEAVLLDKDMDKEDIEELVSKFLNGPLVIKPRNTNYGTGITVFSKKASKKQIMDAIEYAFKFDDNILVEEFAKGMEYRFLVVNGKCLSVAHRRTASVVGDGESTIEELIDAKNKEPWHALTGSPVKKDEPVVEFLSLQGYTYETVIPKGKRVFLRTNSNCSTGGETLDMTQIMPTKFKKIAEKAANAFNGKICGVDIIVDDLEKENYSIIEINDNPGYSINEWPYEGKGEKIGTAILKMLGY